jgi:hypothetical protein
MACLSSYHLIDGRNRPPSVESTAHARTSAITRIDAQREKSHGHRVVADATPRRAAVIRSINTPAPEAAAGTFCGARCCAPCCTAPPRPHHPHAAARPPPLEPAPRPPPAPPPPRHCPPQPRHPHAAATSSAAPAPSAALRHKQC